LGVGHREERYRPVRVESRPETGRGGPGRVNPREKREGQERKKKRLLECTQRRKEEI
jgi:hypothetical protein